MAKLIRAHTWAVPSMWRPLGLLGCACGAIPGSQPWHCTVLLLSGLPGDQTSLQTGLHFSQGRPPPGGTSHFLPFSQNWASWASSGPSGLPVQPVGPAFSFVWFSVSFFAAAQARGPAVTTGR